MATLTSPLSASIARNRSACIPFSSSTPRLPVRRRSTLITVAAQGKPDEKAKKTGPVSGAYKDRLRDEYVGLGGAPNKPMGSNYFLWIIVVISALALAAFLTGSV